MRPLSFLLVEDSDADAVLAEATLLHEGLDFTWQVVSTREAFLVALAQEPDLVLADYSLPSFGGMEALALARKQRPGLPVVFLSGSIGEEQAIECLKAGATDYVLKHRLSRLGPVVRRALHESHNQQQRRLADEALRIAARTQRALLEAASVARVVPWSVEGERLILGHSASEVLGIPLNYLPEDQESLEHLIHPPDRPLLFKALHPADRLQVQTFECRMRRMDEQLVWTRWTVNPHPLHGVFQDISEEKRLQDLLLRSQRLEAIGSLAAGISHDFNNLLQVILCHAETLDILQSSDSPYRQGLRAILSAAKRGRNTIHQLLSFSKRAPLHRGPCHLNELAGQCRAMLEGTLPAGIRWDLALDPALPATTADADQIHQVLVNLLVNARDAMGLTGHLSIRTGRLALGEAASERDHHPAGDYVWVEVGDSGCGIPADRLEHIFEPFYTTKADRGTGLGLSMAQGITESHGGWIEVHSTPETGTRFRIHLPWVPPGLEETAPVPAHHDEWPSGPQRAHSPVS